MIALVDFVIEDSGPLTADVHADILLNNHFPRLSTEERKEVWTED